MWKKMVIGTTGSCINLYLQSRGAVTKVQQQEFLTFPVPGSVGDGFWL